jgi:hypothetical protein
VAQQFDYAYELSGIGEHVSDNSKGCCTQMAIFTRQPRQQQPEPLAEKESRQLELKA